MHCQRLQSQEIRSLFKFDFTDFMKLNYLRYIEYTASMLKVWWQSQETRSLFKDNYFNL